MMRSRRRRCTWLWYQDCLGSTALLLPGVTLDAASSQRLDAASFTAGLVLA